jgi:hypothetical protein
MCVCCPVVHMYIKPIQAGSYAEGFKGTIDPCYVRDRLKICFAYVFVALLCTCFQNQFMPGVILPAEGLDGNMVPRYLIALILTLYISLFKVVAVHMTSTSDITEFWSPDIFYEITNFLIHARLVLPLQEIDVVVLSGPRTPNNVADTGASKDGNYLSTHEDREVHTRRAFASLRRRQAPSNSHEIAIVCKKTSSLTDSVYCCIVHFNYSSGIWTHSYMQLSTPTWSKKFTHRSA